MNVEQFLMQFHFKSWSEMNAFVNAGEVFRLRYSGSGTHTKTRIFYPDLILPVEQMFKIGDYLKVGSKQSHEVREEHFTTPVAQEAVQKIVHKDDIIIRRPHALYFNGELIGIITNPDPHSNIDTICQMLNDGSWEQRVVAISLDNDLTTKMVLKHCVLGLKLAPTITMPTNEDE